LRKTCGQLSSLTWVQWWLTQTSGKNPFTDWSLSQCINIAWWGVDRWGEVGILCRSYSM